ncbi:DUF2381 family protein [Stigmatella aurantiaca]|uniref:Conserved uncharacterized protein n=1 Tax=Stigmatella aurantiaca (strain DW4/3-1) TaxID=378806 RepID=E3FHY1_STIAD|nr:conserved uncharacterized protein [Stigmatella aurantiaca DW4/3-1]
MLLWGTVARAEPTLGGRVVRMRSVTVTGNSAEPLPEVHVAGDIPTLLLFPSPILKKTLTVDESRIRVRDAGEFTIVLQAVTDLREGERHEIVVFFVDGRAPSRAAFVLVTDPTEVDTRIDVQRPEPPVAPCPNEAHQRAPLPEDFVLLGYLDRRGIVIVGIELFTNITSGLEATSSVAYRGTTWVLVEVEIRDLLGRSWTPTEAKLTGEGGEVLPIRLVTNMERSVASGNRARVLIASDNLPDDAGRVFGLEVRGTDDRNIVFPHIRLPAPR